MKIIQLLMTPNDSTWQGVLLGLGDDGVTYHCQTGTWKPYIPALLDPDEQRIQAARDRIFGKPKQTEACSKCGGLGYLPDACTLCGGSGVREF